MLTDLAVLLADGGETISDLAVLREQPEVFGAVASTATAWRVLDAVDAEALQRLRLARAAARERAWLSRAELDRELPAATAGGGRGRGWSSTSTPRSCSRTRRRNRPRRRSRARSATHPLLVFLDNTGEALAGILRPGNAGANTATDHIEVTDLALAQIPDDMRHGTPILFRTDGAGCSRAWLAHLRSLREECGLDVRFSVGFTMAAAVQEVILALPPVAWTPAIEADGSVREGTDVAELTGLLPDLAAAGWPEGMRLIVRRERPHPGAQLTFTDVDGWRFQAFATDTPVGSSPT